jgi:hypothetical protein
VSAALSDALLLAQRRALQSVEKAYVGGKLDAEQATERLAECGITDPVDLAYLLASLDVLKEWGAGLPAEPNGSAPKKATEGQVSYIVDLLKRGQHGPLAEGDLRALTFDRASQLIDALKSGSYDPAEWDVPF